VAGHEYDVCLSFAGEDRPYVDAVAAALRERGIRVFYDAYEKAQLWGKDLYEHLDYIYGSAARYCVLFASEHYAKKLWTNHERRSAQERALSEHGEYVLPARFDETKIPGLRNTVGYVSLSDLAPSELADLIVEKLGPQIRENFMPPIPDRLFDYYEIEDDPEAQELLYRQAQAFTDTLSRMSEDERQAVTIVLDRGCPAELPHNVHINLDLARRLTGFPKSKVLRLLGNVRSLGFTCSTREEEGHGEKELGGPSEMLVIRWNLLHTGIGGNLTGLAQDMVRLAQVGYCDFHGQEALRRVDFAQLASATENEDVHSGVEHDSAA
jgi:hypothetical protein